MRKTMGQIFLALLFIHGAADVTAEAVLDLKLSPSEILPGTSARLDFLIKNDQQVPVQMPARLVMEARPVGGEAFVVTGLGTDDSHIRPLPDLYVGEDESGHEIISVAAGETVEFTLPFNDPYSFFADERLSLPGSYEVRVAFVDHGNDPIIWSDSRILHNV